MGRPSEATALPGTSLPAQSPRGCLRQPRCLQQLPTEPGRSSHGAGAGPAGPVGRRSSGEGKWGCCDSAGITPGWLRAVGLRGIPAQNLLRGGIGPKTAQADCGSNEDGGEEARLWGRILPGLPEPAAGTGGRVLAGVEMETQRSGPCVGRDLLQPPPRSVPGQPSLSSPRGSPRALLLPQQAPAFPPPGALLTSTASPPLQLKPPGLSTTPTCPYPTR